MRLVIYKGRTLHVLLASFIILWLFGGIMDFATFLPRSTVYIAFILWIMLAKDVISFLGRLVYDAWPLYCLMVINYFAYLIYPNPLETAFITSLMYVAVIHAIYEYYSQEAFEYERKFIFYTLLLNIIISGIITYAQLQINPNLARYLGTGLERYQEIVTSQDLVGGSNYSLVSIKGVGSYGYFNTLPFLLIIILYKARENTGTKKILNILCIIAILFLSVKASFVTTIILSLALVGIMLINEFITSQRMRVMLYIVVCGGALLLWFSGIAALVLQFIAEGISNETISVRISGIASFLQGNFDYQTNDFASRVFLLLKSIKTFLKSPIIGSMGTSTSGKIGGHSTFFDVLALYGVFGLLFLGFWNKVKRHFKMRLRYQKTISMGTLYLILVFILNNAIYAQIFIGYLIIIPFGTSVIESECGFPADNNELLTSS